MATIVLSAAGMALGGTMTGTALGLGMGVIGRAAGATLGRVIDQRIMGAGADAVQTGRVDRFRLTGASEGAPISHLYGRMRVAGQVIWATQFLETSATTGGGKGGPPKPKVTEYSYTVSLAIALCEGEISRVGRVWADGGEVARDDLNMRVYSGSSKALGMYRPIVARPMWCSKILIWGNSGIGFRSFRLRSCAPGRMMMQFMAISIGS